MAEQQSRKSLGPWNHIGESHPKSKTSDLELLNE